MRVLTTGLRSAGRITAGVALVAIAGLTAAVTGTAAQPVAPASGSAPQSKPVPPAPASDAKPAAEKPARPAPNPFGDKEARLAAAAKADAASTDKPALADGKSWPVFRGGPELTGLLPADALPDKLDELWKHAVKLDNVRTESSPVIADGRVYFGFDNIEGGGLFALAVKDGAVLWMHKTDSPVRSPPVVAAGMVFVGDDGGIMTAVDAVKGAKLWTFKTDDKIAGSAVVVKTAEGLRVLFGSWDGHLYCNDAATGRPVWKYKTEDQPVNCTPAVAGGHAFISGCDQYLRVINIADGKQAAEIDMGGQAGASPAVVGSRAYVGTFANNVLCIDWKKKEIAWSYKHPDKDQPFYSSAAVAEDRIVVGGRDKLVHCLRRSDGGILWTFATRGKVDGSPVVVGDRVFVGGQDGKLYGLSLAEGKEFWRFDCGSGLAASPAVAEGRMIVVSEEGVVRCFGKK